MSTLTIAQAQERPERRAPVPTGVLGMVLFVAAEIMFFAGLMSAYTIVRAGTMKGRWPPPDQPLLPAASTALNTLALLASGVLLVLAVRRFKQAQALAKLPLLGSWLLGAAFLLLQGREWWALLSAGLTMQSSSMGSFFYLIVGAHALHALVALGVLGAAYLRLGRNTLSSGFLLTTQAFWLFVVGLWPVIYARLYF